MQYVLMLTVIMYVDGDGDVMMCIDVTVIVMFIDTICVDCHHVY